MPFGTTVRRIVEEIGGGLRRGRLMGVMIGGAVGHGGIVAFADDTSLAALIAEIFRFGAAASCGLCVPCRLGAAEIDDAFARLAAGRSGLGRERWDALIAALEQTSVCGHGAGLAEFARSLERHYPRELAECLA